jgi:soluble lytic murein transglycosylase-like protein
VKPALAVERPVANPVATYAGVLRVLNPHLQQWQSRRYATSVLANAQRTHVDPRFIMAIVTVESAWKSNAVSRVGARGLGQLMPGTAAHLQVDAWNPAENLRGTASYLKSLLDRFHGQANAVVKAIAGYNAGPNAVKRFDGIPPFAETQRYVVKVLRVYEQLNSRVGVAWSPYAHHRQLTRRVAVAEVSALSDEARSSELFPLAQIPAFSPAP